MPTRDITNARILVVDDNPTNIELLLALLEDAGYQFLEGLSTPEDIDQKMTSFEPHLILLDYRMPRMNGGDVLTHLHDLYGDDVPPVVMITAQDDKVIRLRSLKLGAIDFLTKPFDYDEVLQRLKNILEAHYLSQERREASLFYQSVANRNSAELEQMALEDALTGLPNRRAVLDEVHTMLQSGSGCSVVFLVIDELEDIAQFHGYPVAEAFIRYLALFLQKQSSDQRLLGSWGQQEYVVVLDAKRDQELVQRAQTLVNLATGDHQFDTLLLTVAARAGISSSLDTNIEPDELIRQAALALPKKGGERVGVFSDELHQMLAERINLRNDLRQAIESGHLQLYFQPKYGLSDGCVNGAEALLRWKHTDKGFISPALFIPLAEETGDILAIGDWVTEQAIRHVSDWQRRNVITSDFVLAINASPQQMMTGSFATKVLAHCRNYGVPPRQIQIEITESAVMQNVNKVQRELIQLTEAGVSVALDDFGTGYSSLSYLQNLPIHVIKIDRCFVMNLVGNPAGQQLVKTIVLMAQNFNCSVVAEGIETAEQAKLLVDMSCDQGQGFLFSRPVSEKDFEQIVQSPAHPIEFYFNQS